MSRIGKEPVKIPGGVDVMIDGLLVTAKGKLGEESFRLSEDVAVSQQDGALTVLPANDGKRARNMWGTTRSQLQNIVTGVSEGFTYNLEIQGVGYRAAVQGKTLNLQLGYSHDIDYPIPDGISVSVERNVSIEVKGSNKAAVGQFCSEVRAFRPPEPYKGKGVRYRDEYVMRKEGKKK
ncbi:MAG: 50S ribosomal protein L6 [Rhodospirillaceae bacterium]|nr:50S ribosomal protein L6 [Rhodospirillaceae bacterium]